MRLRNRALGRAARIVRSDVRRLGSILVLSAFVMVMVLAFTSFTVDLGMIVLTRGQMQNIADAAALGAALELNPNADQDEVEATGRAVAVEIASKHRAGDWSNFILDPNTDVEFGRRTHNPVTGATTFAWGAGARPYNVVRVNARRLVVPGDSPGETIDRRLPLYFGPVIGHTHAPLSVSATASFHPRDMVLVLDYSASMNDDSELKSIGTFGTTAVETNIQTMWEELGYPTYGELDFWPDWVTIPGETHDMDVTWRTNEVDISSNSNFLYVRLYFNSSDYQTFTANTSSGTWSGTGGWSGTRIVKVRVKKSGVWETIDFYDNDDVLRGLGLDDVPYPYPAGSWGEFVNYCRSHNGSMPNYDVNVYNAGHRRKFGMLTLINYWNLNYPKYDETPDLWQVSQQPMQSLKDAVDVLLDRLVEAGSEDQLGLAVYTYPDAPDAILESGLTTDYEGLRTIVHQRQAGHYDR